MKEHRLVRTGGKWFNDTILFEADDLKSIEEWVLENIIADDEEMASVMYDLVHDFDSFNLFLDATLTWEYLVVGKYQIKTLEEPKYQY